MRNYCVFFSEVYQRNMHTFVLQLEQEVILLPINISLSFFKVKSNLWQKFLTFCLIPWLCMPLIISLMVTISLTLKDLTKVEAETIPIEAEVVEDMDLTNNITHLSRTSLHRTLLIMYLDLFLILEVVKITKQINLFVKSVVRQVIMLLIATIGWTLPIKQESSHKAGYYGLSFKCIDHKQSRSLAC